MTGNIELLQLTIPGRATDVDDVLFNPIGTTLGAICIVAARYWLS